MKNLFFRSCIVTISFITILSFPIVNDEFKILKDIVSSENRQMASKPEFNISLLDPFPLKYEKYYNDNFFLRSLFIKYYNFICITLFRKSPIPDQLIIGKEGWFFMAGDEVDAFTGKNNFNDSELLALKYELEFREKYLKERGCKFYFLIAPVKSSIYTEKLPPGIIRNHNKSNGEQIIEYLNKNCQVKPINVFDILRSQKNKDALYYKLDNHWNQVGAFYASNEVLMRIQKDFPEITPTLRSEFMISKTKIHKGNLVNMISDTSSFDDEAIQMSPKSGFRAKEVPIAGYPCVPGFPYCWDYENDKEIPGSKAPKILIITDSFGENIFPFLSEHFSRSVKIFDAWQYKLNQDIVNQENPDIVLLITLEAFPRNILNFQSRLSDINTNMSIK